MLLCERGWCASPRLLCSTLGASVLRLEPGSSHPVPAHSHSPRPSQLAPPTLAPPSCDWSPLVEGRRNVTIRSTTKRNTKLKEHYTTLENTVQQNTKDIQNTTQKNTL
ncbi:hypothetical protein Pcinc_025625 [Petrolisthes cinctipes]|uniref:Uncharacterized protein n=1 Tax=Petrolisthes cinctipes TaxID=88211 RepID=A0AAE1F8F2_PETCI|nr:hypothetical protein Pcinc_025625 [Petrolisthes cinctipes]